VQAVWSDTMHRITHCGALAFACLLVCAQADTYAMPDEKGEASYFCEVQHLDAEQSQDYPHPMRALLIPALLLTSPATAWEASTTPICTLTHETAEAHIHLTYAPSKPLYTLAITQKSAPWQPTPWFAMRFIGPNEIVISTPQHALSDNNLTLNVADSGFGNVLDGLQYNATALAFTEAQTVTIPLDGAAPEVQKFRACTTIGLAQASTLQPPLQKAIDGLFADRRI